MGHAKTFFFSFYDWIRNKLLLEVLWGVVVASAPLSVGWAKLAPKTEEIAAGKKPWLLTKEFADFYDANPKIAFFCFLLPAIAVGLKFLFQWLDKKAKRFRNLPDEGLVTLLRIFLNVVGKKMERTGLKTGEILNANPAIDAFNKNLLLSNRNTAQHNQIESLIDGLYTIFESIIEEPRATLKVTLVLTSQDTFGSWVYFLPQDDGPTTQEAILRKPNSSFSTAVKLRSKTLIVENIRKEIIKEQKSPQKSRFAVDGETDGSILCYPIHHRNLNKVIFVVSVFADKNDVFKEIEREKYEYIFSQFAKRLLVEYNLLVIENTSVGSGTK